MKRLACKTPIVLSDDQLNTIQVGLSEKNPMTLEEAEDILQEFDMVTTFTKHAERVAENESDPRFPAARSVAESVARDQRKRKDENT